MDKVTGIQTWWSMPVIPIPVSLKPEVNLGYTARSYPKKKKVTRIQAQSPR